VASVRADSDASGMKAPSGFQAGAGLITLAGVDQFSRAGQDATPWSSIIRG
jgi:hypothetical protein